MASKSRSASLAVMAKPPEEAGAAWPSTLAEARFSEVGERRAAVEVVTDRPLRIESRSFVDYGLLAVL
jgi:hypothetical protein